MMIINILNYSYSFIGNKVVLGSNILQKIILFKRPEVCPFKTIDQLYLFSCVILFRAINRANPI